MGNKGRGLEVGGQAESEPWVRVRLDGGKGEVQPGGKAVS